MLINIVDATSDIIGKNHAFLNKKASLDLTNPEEDIGIRINNFLKKFTCTMCKLGLTSQLTHKPELEIFISKFFITTNTGPTETLR